METSWPNSFWLFFPICFIICLVLWATKEDDFWVVFKKAFRTFAMLCGLIAVGCFLIFLLGEVV